MERELVNALALGFNESRHVPDGKIVLPFGVGGEFCKSNEVDRVSKESSDDSKLLGRRWYREAASGSRGGGIGDGVESREFMLT